MRVTPDIKCFRKILITGKVLSSFSAICLSHTENHPSLIKLADRSNSILFIFLPLTGEGGGVDDESNDEAEK